MLIGYKGNKDMNGIVVTDTNGFVIRAFTGTQSLMKKDRIAKENVKEIMNEFVEENLHLEPSEMTFDNEEYKESFDRKEERIKKLFNKFYWSIFVGYLTKAMSRTDEDEKFLVGFDGGGTTWRHKMYDEYKANRKGQFTESEKQHLKELMETTQEFISYLDIPMVRVKGVEFDDIAYRLGLTSNRLTNFSLDGDLLQIKIVNRQYKQIDVSKMSVIDNVDPMRDLTIKALWGDKGDNVPNVKKGLGGAKWGAKIDDGTLDSFLKEEGLLEAYALNRRLVDLSMIPKDVVEQIEDNLDNAYSEMVTKKEPKSFAMAHLKFKQVPLKMEYWNTLSELRTRIFC